MQDLHEARYLNAMRMHNDYVEFLQRKRSDRDFRYNQTTQSNISHRELCEREKDFIEQKIKTLEKQETDLIEKMKCTIQVKQKIDQELESKLLSAQQSNVVLPELTPDRKMGK